MKHQRKRQTRWPEKPAPRPPLTGSLEPALAGPPPPPKPLIERLRKPVWYALSCLIFLFYLWTATSSNQPFHLRDTSHEFYNQLTDSLTQGHVYFAAKPSPQLLALPDPYDPAANEPFRLHDASLYRGRYYMYFGVAPALTLYLPWRLLTGKRLSDDIAVTLFSMGGYVFSCLLLFLLLEASQMRVPWFLQLAAVCALGLGQFAPIVLRRPRVYEVALSAGYCFLLGGLYFLARRVVRPNAGRWLPALAALFFGLAAASRPHCAIVAFLVAILYGFYLIRVRGLSGRPWLVELARLALPLAVAGVLIGWYNYSRFDNPLEFGIRYQVGVLNLVNGGRSLATKLRCIFTSLYYLLICPPNFMPRFPFFELSGAAQPFGNPDLIPTGYFQEPVAGALLISPLCFAGVALPFLFWKRLQADVRAVLAGLVVGGFVMFAAACSIPSASGRFGLDFVPALSIDGIFLCLWLSAHLPSRWMRSAAVALTVAVCVWASAVNMALSVNSYGYPLEQPYSPLFRSIATFFGAGPDAFMENVETLRLDATVVFPRAKPEVRETLLASGIYERWDLFFVQYTPGGMAMFAYVHSGAPYTYTYSPWTPISPGTPHRLVVDYSAAAKKVVVRLDDQTVLDFPATFFPTSRDRVALGRMRVARFGLRNFSGRMEVAPNGLVFVARPDHP